MTHRLQGDVPKRAPGDKMSFGFNTPELERRLARLLSPNRPSPTGAPARLGGLSRRTRSRSRYIKWLAIALIAVGMVVAAAGIVEFLSNRAQHTGLLEDHPLIFLPDQTKPSCGPACAYMTLMQGETAAFNFTVLNRVQQQYNYTVNFHLETQHVNITFFVGQLFTISQDGTHTKSPTTISWVAQNETEAQGVASGWHISDLEGQWFSLELTMQWTYQGVYLDGAYLLTYWATAE